MNDQIQQMVHGYRRGHEQLAASAQLDAADSELVTRISDLSGSLSGAPEFLSYLTCYPLPSRRFFAVARTWPDHEASRSGCVLTHTLLVPAKEWSLMHDPQSLSSLFVEPSAGRLSDFKSLFELSRLECSHKRAKSAK